MQVVRDSSESEMVWAFLRAEFRSPRFKQHVRALLNGETYLIDRPRFDDDRENDRRAEVLAGYRGFGRSEYLFVDWPRDVRWVLVEMTVAELGECRYANYPTWVKLSGGSRVVRQGANVPISSPVSASAG